MLTQRVADYFQWLAHADHKINKELEKTFSVNVLYGYVLGGFSLGPTYVR